MKNFIAVLLLVGTCIACKGSQQGKQDMENKEITFEKVYEGHDASNKNQKRFLVINASNELSLLGDENQIEELKQIDFKQKTALVLFLGERSTGGYSIQVENIKEEKNQLLVSYIEKKPRKDDMVITMITYPYSVVSIPKTDKKIIFEELTSSSFKK